MEPSCDTLYVLSKELQKKPLIIRNPSIQTMDPEKFLFLSIVTDRYYFMEIVTKTYNFGTKEGFPRINLVYDRQVNETHRSIVYNGDYYKGRCTDELYPVESRYCFLSYHSGS